MTITIVLPFLPPSLNRVAGRGPYNYRQAKEQFTEQVRLNCLNYRPKKPIDRSTVTIRYYFPDKRRRDPDNYSGKFLLDGLTKAGIIVDDSFNHITLRLEAYCDPERPRTEIVVEEMPDQEKLKIHLQEWERLSKMRTELKKREKGAENSKGGDAYV